MIGRFIDSRKAPGKSPEHLNDPAIQGLAPSVQKSLRGSILLVKMPVAGLRAKGTRLGFIFQAEGQPSLSYSGLFHRRSILAFLRERHVATMDA